MKMELELSNELWDKINNGNVKARDIVEYVLENTFLHFKIKDIKGNLTKENVFSQLSLSQIYNDDEKNIKKAYLKNNMLVLEF
jgi:hypothetical protein